VVSEVCKDSSLYIPMGQHNLALKTFLYSDLALRMVHSKCTDMGGQFCHVALFHPTSLSLVGISAQDRVIFEKIRFGSGVYPRI
jgi:hypothetical protein